MQAIIGTKHGNGKPPMGDSVFFLLRKIYTLGNDEEREAILIIVRKMMRESSDGKDAVWEYWVNHVKDDELRKIGNSLLT